jgi:phytanoyl-CoA hydroxylase
MESFVPGDMDKEQVRSMAASRLQQLRQAVALLRADPTAPRPPAWVHPRDTRSEAALFFDSTGFLHVPSFVSLEIAQSMKEEMAQLVETEWDTSALLDSFGTDAEQNLARGRTFLESATGVHFFAEPAALDAQQQLKEPYRGAAKWRALNKIGHALHTRPDRAWARYAHSEAVRDLVRDLGWRDPVVPQSMYIFKHPEIGGVVHSHQDSTFLYTTPRPTCLGLWLALDDATIDNGCLWVRPGSHVHSAHSSSEEHHNVRRQYQRNVLYFGEESIEARSNVAHGDTDQQPMFEMRTIYEDPDVPWDGALPGDHWESLLAAGFVPVECRAGDVLVFCGTLDHLSLPNRTATSSRDTFQLHLVEGPSQGIEWSPLNWLQYPPEQSFVRLNTDETTTKSPGTGR